MMTIDEFIGQINDRNPPASAEEVANFEATVGHPLPADYRDFLIRCNGGFVGGSLWFRSQSFPERQVEAGVDHVYGFRQESYFSLIEARKSLQKLLPTCLIPIHDDPFGNEVCLGIVNEQRGRIYFWDHENCPEKNEWDGSFATAGNLTLLADSWIEYVADLRPLDDMD